MANNKNFVVKNVVVDGQDITANNITVDSFNVTNGTFSGDLTVDTNTLFVDSTNNRVGIGTSSPSAFLQIEGKIAVGNELGNVNLVNTLDYST